MSKSIKLTAPVLRRIIKEEMRRANKLNEAFTYKEKLKLLQDAMNSLQAAHTAMSDASTAAMESLQDAQELETQSDAGEDPDLNEVVESLEELVDKDRGFYDVIQMLQGLISAVEAMVKM